MIFVGPRFGKSWLASRYFPGWFLGWWPTRRATIASYAQGLALDRGYEVRNDLQEHGMQAFGIRLDQRRKAASQFAIYGHQGEFRAVGVGSGLTGSGADALVIDDPLKDSKEAQSLVIRDNVWQWYLSTASTRLMPGGAIVLIQTRWNDDDLGGRLLKRDPTRDKHGRKLPDGQRRTPEEGGEGDEWQVICLPSLAEDWVKHPMMDGPDPLGREIGEALWPEQFPAVRLEHIRSVDRYWFTCTPAESPVLMADWRCKPISEVRPGDDVVGFKRGTRDARARLERSTVKRVSKCRAVVCDFEMESGRKVRATADHRWYTGRADDAKAGRKMYAPARVGARLMFVCPPEDTVTSAEQLMLWWYLAGIVDGEGYISPSALCISQCPESNPGVFMRIGAVLDRLGLDYKVDVRATADPKWGSQGQYRIRNAMAVYRKLLRLTECAKAPEMVGRLFERGHMFIRDRDRVEAIVPGQEEDVYALETTTGNYVVWGYASSNSMHQQRPAEDEGGIFKASMFRYWTWVDREHGLLEFRRGDTGRGLGQAPEVGDTSLVDLSYCTLFQTADTAATEETYSDWTVIATWAVTPERELLLLDVAREKIDTTKQSGWAVAQYDRWRPAWVGIEDKTFGLALFQQLRVAGYPCRALKADRDKISRASVAGVLCENGRVYFPGHAPWLEDWELELKGFPNWAHDDQVDVFGYAAIELPKVTVGDVRAGSDRPVTEPLGQDRVPVGYGREGGSAASEGLTGGF